MSENCLSISQESVQYLKTTKLGREQVDQIPSENISAYNQAGTLASKIIAGDKAAGNEFVQLHYRWLLFVVRKKFSHSANHEDIVQDAFILVLEKLQNNKVKKPDAIRAFLRTTAILIGFEYLRKDKKYTSAIDQEMLIAVKDAKVDVASEAEWNDSIRFVKQVMKELKKDRDRQILTKFYFNDEDKNNICDDLSLSAEHFDRVLYRAKQRLKELINKANNDKGQHNKNARGNSATNTHIKDKAHQQVLKIIHMFLRFFDKTKRELMYDHI